MVLAKRGDDAEDAADHQRQDQRRAAELDRHGQADAEQVCHGEVGEVVARAEVAAEDVAEVVQVLLPERVVEVVGGLKIGLYRRIEAAFDVERAAGAMRIRKNEMVTMAKSVGMAVSTRRRR